MIIAANGQRMPSYGKASYWGKLTTLQGQPTLYGPLSTLIRAALETRIAAGDSFLRSKEIGAEALKDLPQGWFGQFHRTFQGFKNGDEAGIAGMEIYRQLADRPSDKWEVLTDVDPHGVWDTVLYRKL